MPKRVRYKVITVKNLYFENFRVAEYYKFSEPIYFFNPEVPTTKYYVNVLTNKAAGRKTFVVFDCKVNDLKLEIHFNGIL